MTIKEALGQLDPANDAHWTIDGLPVIAVVAGLVGDEHLSREVITASDPDFCREAAKEAKANGVQDEEPKEKTPKVTSKDIEAQLNHLAKCRADLDAEIKRTQQKYSALLEKEERERERKGQGNIIGRYIKEQNKIRARRHSVIDDPRAQIDKAMERKRGFGRNRPNMKPPEKKS